MLALAHTDAIGSMANDCNGRLARCIDRLQMGEKTDCNRLQSVRNVLPIAPVPGGRGVPVAAIVR
jgi:hypothetical protein